MQPFWFKNGRISFPRPSFPYKAPFPESPLRALLPPMAAPFPKRSTLGHEEEEEKEQEEED